MKHRKQTKRPWYESPPMRAMKVSKRVRKIFGDTSMSATGNSPPGYDSEGEFRGFGY